MNNYINKVYDNSYPAFSDKLENLYADMDKKYKEISGYYGFDCKGCENNCCMTRFYHHTFSEYFYIIKGFKTLSPEKQAEIRKKAKDVCLTDSDKKIMCPLNSEGLCLLYEYRPMICRLHGISHEFLRPDGKIIYGTGCEAFTKQTQDIAYLKFDRTPFYKQMAELEKELRQHFKITDKLKISIAEMLAF